jgi:hypothetical protein
MDFVSAIGALTTRWRSLLPRPVTDEPRWRLAEIEKDHDRTSDAFTEALNLLERSLPRSFGA